MPVELENQFHRKQFNFIYLNILKKILFPVFSLFLCYLSVDLIKGLIKNEPNEYSNIEALLLSFLLSLFITGIFAFLGFAYPTSKILPESYYAIHNPKFLHRISEVLGIKYFKYLLLFAFWGNKKNRKKYFNGTKKGLQNFVYQTKQSEFGHLAAFLVILIISIILLIHGFDFLVIITSLLNLIGNIYPVILQRTHRIRIEKITVKL